MSFSGRENPSGFTGPVWGLLPWVQSQRKVVALWEVGRMGTGGCR